MKYKMRGFTNNQYNTLKIAAGQRRAGRDTLQFVGKSVERKADSQCSVLSSTHGMV
jgi:hypothetical protein